MTQPRSPAVLGFGPFAAPSHNVAVDLKIESDREADGRWIAEIFVLPGCMAYGATEQEAVARVQALALRVIAERLEHGEGDPLLTVSFIAA